MSDGRTVWLAKDAAWWRREAVIEMLEEVGPVGPAVVDWLACEAKAQNQGGMVKAGYRAIAHGLFIELSTVCPLVSLGVRVGLLDDFEEDGRTFTCRISGWESEQGRAIGAAKKARQRAASERDSPANRHFPFTSASPAVSPPAPPSPEMSPTGQDRTGHIETPTESRPVSPDVARLCDLLASLIRSRDPKAKCNPTGKAWTDAIRLLTDADGRDPVEIERIIRWCQADGFWQRNILSAPKLREKFTQLVAAAGQQGPGLRPVVGGKYDAAAAAKAEREEAA